MTTTALRAPEAAPGGAAAVPQRVRLVDAALRCIARHGTRKVTVDDIAREAGISRATLYRAFPGGRDAVLAATVETEAARFFSALAVEMGQAEDLEAVFVSGITSAAAYLSAHEALQYLARHEPDVVMTHLRFGQMDDALARATAFAAPFFTRWLDPADAARAAEVGVRLLLSYTLEPTAKVDLADPVAVGAQVRRYVLPAFSSPQSVTT